MPFLVSLEGIDNLGKTTQANRLVANLSAVGIRTSLSSEFSPTPLGVLIDSHLKYEWMSIPPQVQVLLVAADKMWSKSIYSKEQPEVVVADRSIDSLLVYQFTSYRLRFGFDESFESWVRQVAWQLLPKPDITFLLEGEPALSMERGLEHVVDETFLAEARYLFLQRQKQHQERIRIIDATLSIDETASQILDVTLHLINTEADHVVKSI